MLTKHVKMHSHCMYCTNFFCSQTNKHMDHFKIQCLYKTLKCEPVKTGHSHLFEIVEQFLPKEWLHEDQA